MSETENFPLVAPDAAMEKPFRGYLRRRAVEGALEWVDACRLEVHACIALERSRERMDVSAEYAGFYDLACVVHAEVKESLCKLFGLPMDDAARAAMYPGYPRRDGYGNACLKLGLRSVR